MIQLPHISLTRGRILWACGPAVLLLAATTGHAEDGYRLWLRYDVLPSPAVDTYRSQISSVLVDGKSQTFENIKTELTNGLNGLLGRSIPLSDQVARDGTVVVLTSRSQLAGKLAWKSQLSSLGQEGFRIEQTRIGNHTAIVIAAEHESGALYGAFHFLQL